MCEPLEPQEGRRQWQGAVGRNTSLSDSERCVSRQGGRVIPPAAHSPACHGGILQRDKTGLFRPTGDSFRNETYLLELTKKPKRHFFCIDPLVKPELPRFIGVRHDIVFEIKNCFAKSPCDKNRKRDAEVRISTAVGKESTASKGSAFSYRGTLSKEQKFRS
jgi:hypothetical protein